MMCLPLQCYGVVLAPYVFCIDMHSLWTWDTVLLLWGTGLHLVQLREPVTKINVTLLLVVCTSPDQ